jgi:hypothetical protein
MSMFVIKKELLELVQPCKYDQAQNAVTLLKEFFPCSELDTGPVTTM